MPTGTSVAMALHVPRAVPAGQHQPVLPRSLALQSVSRVCFCDVCKRGSFYAQSVSPREEPTPSITVSVPGGRRERCGRRSRGEGGSDLLVSERSAVTAPCGPAARRRGSECRLRTAAQSARSEACGLQHPCARRRACGEDGASCGQRRGRLALSRLRLARLPVSGFVTAASVPSAGRLRSRPGPARLCDCGLFSPARGRSTPWRPRMALPPGRAPCRAPPA